VGRSGERGVARPRRGRNTLVDARSPPCPAIDCADPEGSPAAM